jgi:hypothetical protein
MIGALIVAAILVLELLTLLAAVAGAEYLLFRSLRASGRRSRRQTTGSAPRDPEAAAAIAEAVRIVTTARRVARRRPRCVPCQQPMDRDVTGRFWHCTRAGCPGSLLSTDSSPLWAPDE